MDIRLPRIILAGLVGAALAVAGATYQGLFRNPLADPYLIGVAQGAGLGAIPGLSAADGLAELHSPHLRLQRRSGGGSRGIFCGQNRQDPACDDIDPGRRGHRFLSHAITSYLMIISHDKLYGIISWILGTFSLSNWQQVVMVLPYIIIGIGIISFSPVP